MFKRIKSLTLLLGLASIVFSSCITTRTTSLQSKSEDIEIYTTLKPQVEYVEISYIQADGAIFNTPKQLLTKLKKKASAQDADAIINVKYDYQFWWPYASCTAIKYSDN